MEERPIILHNWLLFYSYQINSSQKLIENFHALYLTRVKISAPLSRYIGHQRASGRVGPCVKSICHTKIIIFH